MPDQSEAPIVRPHLDDILRDWTDGTMDAAGTIEDLVERIDEAAEIIRLCEEALEAAKFGFEKHARHWAASAARTSSREDKLRSENALALAEGAAATLAQIKGQNP